MINHKYYRFVYYIYLHIGFVMSFPYALCFDFHHSFCAGLCLA
jgi:hypothetical protein